MAKLTFLPIFFAVVTLFSGCKEPEYDFIFVQNNTQSEIVVTASFASANSERNQLKLTLAPEQRDGWRYTTEGNETDKVDSELETLLISSKNCEVELDRPQLKRAISRDGAWLLVVSDELMGCDR